MIFRKLKGFEVFKIDLEIESYSVGLVQGFNLYSRRGMSFTSGVVEINCNFLLTYLLDRWTALQPGVGLGLPYNAPPTEAWRKVSKLRFFTLLTSGATLLLLMYLALGPAKVSHEFLGQPQVEFTTSGGVLYCN